MKAYATNVTLKLKHIQTTGKLIGIHAAEDKASKPVLVIPETLENVRQFYIPESLVGASAVSATDLYTRDDCETAIVKVDKATKERTVNVIPREKTVAVKTSDLPKNVVNLTVHDAVEADKVMFPLQNAQSYVFYPDTVDPDNVQNYNLLTETLKKSSLALCSVVNLQNHEGLFRLGVWRDRLCLIKQGYTDQINPHEVPDEGEFVSIPSSVIDKAVSKFSKMVEPINGDTYRNRIAADFAALTSSVQNDELVSVSAQPEQSFTNLDALLDAFDEE